MHVNRTNLKKYIGITSKPVKIRWKKGKGYSDRLPMGRAFRKYGWDGFDHYLLYENIDEETAKHIEKALIKGYNTQDSERGYNLCSGGEGISGYHHTEETKRIIAEKASKRTGEKNSNYGNKWTDEMRQRLIESMRKRNLTEETHRRRSEAAKKRIGKRNPFYGKTHSEEIKEKLSKLRRKPVKQYSLDGTFIKEYDSVKSAAEDIGISDVAISSCCRGATKTSGGFKWEYSNKD